MIGSLFKLKHNLAILSREDGLNLRIYILLATHSGFAWMPFVVYNNRYFIDWFKYEKLFTDKTY